MSARNTRFNTEVLMAAVVLATAARNTIAGKPPAQAEEGTKRHRYLLLDSRIIETADNAKLVVGTVRKDENNPLFREDKPWEPRYDNVYANVIYDRQESLYKCWYSPFIVDERTTSTPPEKRNSRSRDYMGTRPRRREMGVCYAVSKDGIRWAKPQLGLVEFGGDRKNNIVMRGEDMRGMFHGPHGAGVIKDLREKDAAKRYKMFFRAQEMAVSFSPDGIHWDWPILCGEIRCPGDTHNNAFWAPILGKYVGITRLKTGSNIRLVARTESPDFLNWTKAEVVYRGVTDQKQAHDMVVFPTGGVYIGLMGIMEFPRERSNYHVRQHVELAWSPDTVTWHRIQEGTPFIAHSPAKTERYGAMPYDWGTIFASAPIFLEDEVRIYYGACNWFFFDWRKGYLALARLRPDGWAGYEQVDGAKPARIATTPVVCSGDRLQLSADVRKNGFVKVTLLDRDARELAVSEPVTRTVTDARVKWREGFSLKGLRGKECRLRFQLRYAKLYSFGFDLKSQAGIISARSGTVMDSKEAVEKIVGRIMEKQREAAEARKRRAENEDKRRTQRPEQQIPGYIAELKEADPSIRARASDELAKIAGRVRNTTALLPAVAPLVAAMRDSDMDVRDESAEALGAIASRISDAAAVRSAIAVLVTALSDKSAEVREEAAESLGYIAAKTRDKAMMRPAVRPLIRALEDEKDIRMYAARALEHIGTPEARAAVRERR